MTANSIRMGRRPFSARSQGGVSLIVVMAMVLIMGLMSVLGLRSAIFTTSISGNSRVQSLALEAAEAGLRYCEKAVVKPLELPDDGEPEAVRWRTRANWFGPDKLSSTVTTEWINSNDSLQKYPVPPECMVESLRLPIDSDSPSFLVTSRGFSPDVTFSADGRTLSGAEVWLQSTLQR